MVNGKLICGARNKKADPCGPPLVAWNLVYGLLEERGLFGDGFDVQEYTGIHSWLDGPTRKRSSTLARWLSCSWIPAPVDAIAFRHDLLGVDDPKNFFVVTE